jgi:hypothetical protein
VAPGNIVTRKNVYFVMKKQYTENDAVKLRATHPQNTKNMDNSRNVALNIVVLSMRR